MRHFLILAALICGLGLSAVFAQEAAPAPSPAPMRDADGQFLGAAAEMVEEMVEENGGDGSELLEGELPPEDSAAAAAAEQAARAEALKEIGAAPQPVTLSAKLVDDGPIIPSGLTWRIFSADATNSSDIELVQRSEQATAVVSLPPGEYLVQSAYGFAQATDTLTVLDEPQSRVLVLDAGALRLNAKVTGGTDIAPRQLKFEVYPQGQEDDPRAIIVGSVQPGEIIHLTAGVYHVVSKYGALNAVAATDIRVEKGQLTDATLFHDAAQVSLRLVSEIGGEAIADVDWTIKDASDTTVYQFTGTFPSAILEAGDYVVLARRGTAVYNRDFSVVPGTPQEIQVLTAL